MGIVGLEGGTLVVGSVDIPTGSLKLASEDISEHVLGLYACYLNPKAIIYRHYHYGRRGQTPLPRVNSYNTTYNCKSTPSEVFLTEHPQKLACIHKVQSPITSGDSVTPTKSMYVDSNTEKPHHHNR